ncbi:hypothetical protein [Hartmannibacter diazotrophicus]|uniref:hypothetical protein n=1 Tax=Hartmannibacter diazotrophicus TaxID=1482074 RepID=UPI000C151F65|nr:hypothetical protein [Hartmannibacter diazotrophicus]
MAELLFKSNAMSELGLFASPHVLIWIKNNPLAAQYFCARDRLFKAKAIARRTGENPAGEDEDGCGRNPARRARKA